MNQTLIQSQREKIKPATYVVDGAAFAAAITPLARLAAASAYPAVTLAFRDQRVTVAATDFVTHATVKVPVQGKKATTVAVDGKRLVKYAKAFSAGDVTIDVSAETVKFTVPSSSGDGTELSMPPRFDSPAVTVQDIENGEELNVAAFRRAVRMCAPVASTDEARVALTGVLFDQGRAVATDSYRLAVYRAAPTTFDGLFPASGLKIAGQLFDEADVVTAAVVDDNLVLRSAMRAISIRKIDTPFPAWEQLVKLPEASTVVSVARAALMASLDKVVLAADEGTPCRFQIESENVFLSVKNHDVAESFDPLPIEMTGDLQLVAYNGGYLRSLLAGVDSEVVSLKVIDHFKPTIIVDGDESKHDYDLLIMPVRV